MMLGMVPEFGQFALILALCLALIQAFFPLLGAIRNNAAWISLAKPAALGQCFFLLVSFFTLMYAFVSNDFSVAYVAENSNTQLPLFYKITALWGAHEGSLLLWSTVLGLWTGAVALGSKQLPPETQARVLGVLALVSIGFLILLLLHSDPFQRLLPIYPKNGRDLNPLLQDPGLALHPPLLYCGYVGFAVAFAFAITALLSGKLDAAWVRWSRPWVLAAWCFLTIGITLGSWWSYRVLGWGGWWFWDPVENASFLPWLTGTALLHSLAVTEKRGAFKSWTLLLAITAFALSLVGTFLVRSGILVSVHAFAVDPDRGAYILKFLFMVVGGSLLLYAWRAPKIRGVGQFHLLSRETLLLMNNVLLMVAMATILLGTIYPLILEGLGLGKISVGPPYFNSVFIPLLTPLLFLMGLGPQCSWKQMQPHLLLQKLKWVLVMSLLLGIVLPLLIVGRETAYVVLGLSLGLWILLATLQNVWHLLRQVGGLRKLPRNQIGMTCAHIGIAVCVIGVTLTSVYSVERDVRMRVGSEVTLGGYQFYFKGITPLKAANYKGFRANFRVRKANKVVTVLHPEKRLYIENVGLSKPGIDAGVWRDLYVTVGEPLGKQSWAVRIYVKPFVRWIWGGGFIMLIGGLIALTDRRYRVEKS